MSVKRFYSDKFFLLSVIVAAAVRLYLLSQYYCISSDGIHYIAAARHFYAGDFSGGLGSVYPPAYPTLVALTYGLIGDWELAGQIISLACGVLLLFPLYLLADEVYGRKVAVIACFLGAISPYLARYAVHVRTESPFFFLSMVVLLLFYQGIITGNSRRIFYGGLVAGFAYLVRPEAIGFLVIVPITLMVTWWFKRERGFVWFARAFALLFIGFFIFALPYVVYLSSASGKWGSVSKKAGLTFAIALKDSGLL